MSKEEILDKYTMYLVIEGLKARGVLTESYLKANEDYLRENNIDYHKPQDVGRITLDDDKNCRQTANSIVDAGTDIYAILGHEKYADHNLFPEHGEEVVMHFVKRRIDGM